MVKKVEPPFEAPPGTMWYDPEQREQPQPDEPEAKPNGKHRKPEALPFAYVEPFDASTLPKRAWLHAGHYIRKHVVMTVGPGGWGKTTLILTNALEIACGRGMLGPAPKQQRVLYWNGEDPIDEIMRRIAAICIQHNVDMEEFRGHLVIGDKLKEGRLAYVSERNLLVLQLDVLQQFERFIAENQIALAIIDPLVAFHQVPEANNTAMEKLVSTLSGIAERCDMCIELNHHTRKPSANFEITVDDSRGAGAIANAARSVRVLNRMTAEEAKMPGIADDDRRAYLRVNRDKSNLMPASKASWIHLVSVDLPNGDKVQALTAWDYPQPFDGVSADDMRWMRDECRRKDYLRNPNAGERWVGAALSQRLNLNIKKEADRKRLSAILKVWVENGVLSVIKKKDETRHEREFVVPGDWNEGGDDASTPF